MLHVTDKSPVVGRTLAEVRQLTQGRLQLERAPTSPTQARSSPGEPSSPDVPRIDTERFYLRSLTPSDAGARWQAWLADPEVMHPLHIPAGPITLEQLRARIERQSSAKSLLIGIFDRSSDLHIGYYKIRLDPRHRLAHFTVVIGDKDFWGGNVVLETRAALLDYLFDERDVAKAVGMPPSRNFPSIFNYRAEGWRLEGILRSHREALVPRGRIDQLIFGMTKEDWRARRRELGSGSETPSVNGRL